MRRESAPWRQVYELEPFTVDFPKPLPAVRKFDAWWLELDGLELRLSNLDKVFWPREGFTKGDLLAYYYNAAGTIRPYVADRPLTLKRMPGGQPCRGLLGATRAGTTVSTPLSWEEVLSGSVRPGNFTIRTIFDRLAEVGDLFAAVLEPQDLDPALDRLGVEHFRSDISQGRLRRRISPVKR